MLGERRGGADRWGVQERHGDRKAKTLVINHSFIFFLQIGSDRILVTSFQVVVAGRVCWFCRFLLAPLKPLQHEQRCHVSHLGKTALHGRLTFRGVFSFQPFSTVRPSKQLPWAPWGSRVLIVALGS